MSAVTVPKIFNFYYEVPLTKELEQLLHSTEQFKVAVKTIRYVGVFTDKRILVAGKQGIISVGDNYSNFP